MGWFSRIVDRVIDPILPESAKSTVDKFLPEVVKKNDALKAATMMLGGAGAFGGMAGTISNIANASMLAGYINSAGGDGSGNPIDIGNLSVDEIANLSSSRLARIGKYFTSPLGVLSGASTGSGKVFS